MGLVSLERLLHKRLLNPNVLFSFQGADFALAVEVLFSPLNALHLYTTFILHTCQGTRKSFFCPILVPWLSQGMQFCGLLPLKGGNSPQDGVTRPEPGNEGVGSNIFEKRNMGEQFLEADRLVQLQSTIRIIRIYTKFCCIHSCRF